MYNLPRAAHLFPLALFMCACSSEGEKAEKQYNFLKSTGASAHELCEAGKEVEAGYLKDQDKDKYMFWKVISGGECAREQNEKWNLGIR